MTDYIIIGAILIGLVFSIRNIINKKKQGGCPGCGGCDKARIKEYK